MSSASIDELTNAAIGVIQAPGRAALITPDHPTPEMDREEAKPEFELFHFGFSICSHKVRAVLAELGLTYGSNQYAGPTTYENYTPEYMRLRLQSEAAKGPLVSGYTGGSAVESEGFDPAVVPTLVDRQAGKVLADSKLISLHLVRTFKTPIDLLPVDLEDKIIDQVDLVDRTPHVALLYGADPAGDTRPAEIQSRMPGIHQLKSACLEGHKTLVGDEPRLVAAYDAKIAKERAAESFVVDPNAMTAALDQLEDLLTGLDSTLASSDGPWMLGQRFTLADVVWGISLIRFDYLGRSSLWQERPRVAAYFDRVSARPSLVSAVLNWPGSRNRIQTDTDAERTGVRA